MFWFKKKVIEVKKVIKEKNLEEKLNNPFEIWKMGANYDCPFYILVFRFDISGWDHLSMCSKLIAGLKNSELARYAKECFGDENVNFYSHDASLYFKNKEDAERIIEEFRPYYDTYHIPRAVAERLTCYDEEGGGIKAPIYLKERAGIQGAPITLKAVK